MKIKKLLTKSLLVAVCLLVGANVAWGASNVITYDLTGKFTSGTSTACVKTDNKITTPEAIATELNKNATYTFTWSGSPRAKGDGTGLDVSTSANGTFTISGLSGGEMIIVKSHALNDNRSLTVAKGQKCVVDGVDVETTSAKTVASPDGTYSPIYMKAGATSLTITSATSYTILESVSIITPETKYTRNVTYGDDNIWTSTDLTEWNSNSHTQYAIDIPASSEDTDAHYGLGFNNENKTGSSLSVSKNFSFTNADSKVKYEITWRFGGAPGYNSSNYNSFYVKIGNNICLTWNQQNGATGSSNYGVHLKTDGTYGASNDDILVGLNKNNTYSKDIVLIFDKATKKIEFFSFDGTNYTSKVSGTFDDAFNTVTSGLNRVAPTNEYSVSNYITNIKVTEYERPKYAYTINYKYGGDIISSEAGTAGEGETVEATLNSMWNEGNTQKYFVSGSATTSFTTKDSGNENVFEVALREAETWNYFVKAKKDEEELCTLSTNTVIEGETASYAYPQYISIDGALYISTRQSNNPWWGKSFTPTANNESQHINYSAVAGVTDVVFCKEAEDITSLTPYKSGNTSNRASNKGGAYAATADRLITTLPAGTYKLHGACYGNAGTTFTFNAGEKTVFTLTTDGNPTNTDGEEFTLTETTAITMTGGIAGSNDNVKSLDYIYITGTPDNEIIGALDKSTSSADNVFGSDIVLKKGDIKKITFKNHGSDYGKNWMLKYSYGGSEVTTIRADWFWKYEGDGNASKRLGLYTEPYTSANGLDWNTWTSDMDNSTVVLTVSNVNGIFAVDGTMTGSSDTYYLKYAYNNSFDGDITLNLSVNLSWLEVLSVEQTAVGITTTAAGKGWATLYTDKGLDFSNVDGLTAYTATIDNSTVKLNKVDDIQANTGVVLKSSTEDANTTYSIPVIASSSTEKGSMAGNATEGVALEENTAYILGINGSGNAQFFINSAGTIAAGKAYLPVGTNLAKALTVVFADDVTGIANVNAAEAVQPVKRIVKGQLVIEKNGKRYNAAGAEF